jgi:hypothetical protein
MFGFRARDYFQIEGADAVVPTVNLRNEPPQAAPPATPPAEPPQA